MKDITMLTRWLTIMTSCTLQNHHYDIDIQQKEPSYDIDIQADAAEIGGTSQYVDNDNDNHSNNNNNDNDNDNDNVVEIVSDSDDEGGGNAGESSTSLVPLMNPPSSIMITDTTSVISESQLQTLVSETTTCS